MSSLLGINIVSNNIYTVKLSHDYNIENMQTIPINMARFKNQAAAVAIPYSQVIVKEIGIQQELTSLEIKNIIKFNIDTKNFYFDYDIKNDLLTIVAAPKKLIHQTVFIFKKMGVEIKIIDIDKLATERANTHLKQQPNLNIPPEMITSYGLAMRDI